MSYFREENYVGCLKEAEKALKIDSNDTNSLRLKIVCLYKMLAKNEPVEITQRDWKQIVRGTFNSSDVPDMLSHLSKLVYLFGEMNDSLPKCVFKIYPEIYAHADDLKQGLIDILLKEGNLTLDVPCPESIQEFCTSMLNSLKDRHSSPDRAKLVKLLTKIANSKVAIDENTCRIIENLTFKDEKVEAIECLEVLVKYSKHHIDTKIVGMLSEVVRKDDSSYETRFAAFKTLIYFVKNNPENIESQIRKAINFVLEENNEEMTKFALIGLKSLPPEELREKNISLLSSLKAYDEKQMLWMIKILNKYYKANESLPKCAYVFLTQEG